MKKQIKGVTVDVTPRKIELAYRQYEIICEALNGHKIRPGNSFEKGMQERLKISRYLVDEWQRQNEEIDKEEF